MTLHKFSPILALIGMIVIAGPGLAQDAPATKIATVSIGRIQAQYGDLQTEQRQLEQWLAEKRKLFNLMRDYVFLSADNFSEASDLLKKQQRTQEEQTRLDELRNISDTKDKRFRDLEAKANRTPQEQDEYNSLQDIYRTRVKAIEDMWQQTLAELNQRRQQAVNGLMGKVTEAIRAEAEAQGFTIVFDADAVFFGGTDITEQVLARLNAGQPATGEGGDNAGGGQ